MIKFQDICALVAVTVFITSMAIIGAVISSEIVLWRLAQ